MAGLIGICCRFSLDKRDRLKHGFCDPRDIQSQNQKRYPKLIIEVLSKSTESFDRGDKFADYQQIETLEEYLVNTKRQRLDCFCCNPERLWMLMSYSEEQDEFQLSCINFEGKFADQMLQKQ